MRTKVVKSITRGPREAGVKTRGAHAVGAKSLREKFFKESVPTLQKEMGLANALAVPRVVKVVINAGIGKHSKDAKFIDSAASGLAELSGQRPVKTLARAAIAGFKIREGNVIGLMVTLRGKRMYDFLAKLCNVSLPRVRDFRGLSVSGFDEHGNYSIGIREHLVFPEVSPDAIESTFPLQITVVTTAKNKVEGYKLLKSLGFPFHDEVGQKIVNRK